MRVLIVDDEVLARERLKMLLAAFQDLEVIGEAADGEQAIELISAAKPELIFLDIQMPGCTGLEVANALPSPRPKIVFCTAFDQYAVDAFELHAVDYLLKPVNRMRLASAVERARSIDTVRGEVAIEQATQAAKLRPARFLGRKGSRYQVIAKKDAVFFASDNGLTVLHTTDDRFLVEPTLNDFEQRLDPVSFFRISRTAIVNLNWVKDVESLAGGYGQVTLKNGTRLDVSRRRFRELLSALGGDHCERPAP